MNLDDATRFRPHDPCWVQSGGVGWSVGAVLAIKTNRRGETIVRVGYVRFVEVQDRSYWLREGVRRARQLRPRNPKLKGADKPPLHGKKRRVRCGECQRLDGHYDWCKVKADPKLYTAGAA